MNDVAKMSIKTAIDIHKTLILIRKVEENLISLFANDEIPGFIHLSIGQEAVAAGVIRTLGVHDTFATTHRGHGHVVARGLDLDLFFMEIMGRASGVCKGRGGSMHVSDMRLGIIGANGIVGAGIPIALGSALAHSVKGTGGVAAAFFGDGAMAEGSLHESLNIASLWNLPMFFICENNGWSEFSPTSNQFAGNLEKLANAFGINFQRVDGTDASMVAAAASKAIKSIRAGKGPYILECITHRVRGHYEGDPQKYRDDSDTINDPAIDPITKSIASLRKLGVSEEEIKSIETEAAERVDAAIENARADGFPDFEAAIGDVYTELEDLDEEAV